MWSALVTVQDKEKEAEAPVASASFAFLPPGGVVQLLGAIVRAK
jgi:hypothetical protein